MEARRFAIIGAAAATAAAVGLGTWVALAGDESEATGPPPNLTVELQQYRVDEPLHRVRLLVSNQGTTPVVIEASQLVSPDFDLVPSEAHDAELAPGGKVRLALPTAYGPAICGGEVRREANPARARLGVRAADGDIDEFEYPLDDRHGYLDTLLRRDCEIQKINSSIEVTFGDTWEERTTDDGKLAVRNHVQLRLLDSNATVEVVQLVGSVIFTLNGVPPRDPLARVDGSTQQTELVVDFTNNRCDLHAVGESSHTYVFQFWFSVDGSEPISRTFSPDDVGLEALRGLINRGCGLSG